MSGSTESHRGFVRLLAAQTFELTLKLGQKSLAKPRKVSRCGDSRLGDNGCAGRFRVDSRFSIEPAESGQERWGRASGA